MKGVSGRAVRLEMWWGEQRLAIGSGFIASIGGAHFLVTVRHNFSGRRWPDNELLSSRGVVPDRVVVKMQVAASGVLAWSDRSLPLLDANERPLWYEHPRLGRRADIAALPLEDDDQWFVDSFDISQPEPGEEPLLAAGDDLFVVGFPRGFTPYIGVPIWTRASVASEPGLPYDGLPMFLVDARTRTGHSGSAVVLRPGVSRAVRMRDESLHISSIEDAWIVGLYSGRVRIPGAEENEGSDGDETQVSSAEILDIGLVWRTGAILATIEGRTRFPAVGDDPPHWDAEWDRSEQ